MKKTIIPIWQIFLCTVVLLLGSSPGIEAYGQEEEKYTAEQNQDQSAWSARQVGAGSAAERSAGGRLVLQEIVFRVVKDSGLQPTKVDVNAKEGYVEFTVPYSGNCLEKYRFEYRFDQDMSTLGFGEGRGATARKYGFDVSIKVLNGGCERDNWNPKMGATSSDGGFSGVLQQIDTNEPGKYEKRVMLIGGSTPWITAYPAGNARKGSGRGAFVTYKYNDAYDSYYSWLGFKISAKGSYEILFIYKQAAGSARQVGGGSAVERSAGERLVLQEIIHDFYKAYTLKVEKVDVNAKEGYVEFTVGYSGNCIEKYRFVYRFDQDMSALGFGEGRGAKAREYGFDVSLKVLKGGCNRGNWNPKIGATSSDGGFSSVLHKMFKNEPDRYKKRVMLIGGSTPWITAYPAGNEEHGSGRGAFVTYKYNDGYDSYYSWLGFKIVAIGSYEISFLYQQEN